jgi:hypothetical protein
MATVAGERKFGYLRGVSERYFLGVEGSLSLG